MEASVEAEAPLPGKHSWHAGSSIAGLLLTSEDVVALTTIPGLDCACHVSLPTSYCLAQTDWPMLCTLMASLPDSLLYP